MRWAFEYLARHADQRETANNGDFGKVELRRYTLRRNMVSGVSDKRTKRNWFDRGVIAAQRTARLVLPTDTYICPVCHRGLDLTELQNDEVTFEHAPPKNQGGKEVALTCRTCNQAAGEKLDEQLHRQELSFDFALGTLNTPSSVRLEFGDTRFNGMLTHVDDTISVAAGKEQKHNPPGTQERVAAEFTGREEYSGKIHLLQFGHDEQLARVSLLRAAFVLAFAVFGYRFALAPSSEKIRRQILNPDENVICSWGLLEPKEPKTRRRLLILREPENLQSILVQIGRWSLFVQGPWSQRDLYATVEQLNSQEKSCKLTFKGTEIEWPTSPQYALDFANDKQQPELAGAAGSA